MNYFFSSLILGTKRISMIQKTQIGLNFFILFEFIVKHIVKLLKFVKLDIDLTILVTAGSCSLLSVAVCEEEHGTEVRSTVRIQKLHLTLNTQFISKQYVFNKCFWHVFDCTCKKI